MLFVPKGFDQDNAEQMEALHYLEQTSMSLFLTGSAGTGKSYFLQHYCEVTHKKFIKLAPTGLAALNVRGQTIHSFFRLPLSPLTDPSHISAITRRYRKDKREVIRQLDLIIIDEISMVRCDVLDAMDRILRSVRHSKVPFGGVQLLMVGDPFQLPPVTTADDRKEMQRSYPKSDAFYFFDAHVYTALAPHAILLCRMYRQSDQRFVSALEEIRLGHIGSETVDLLNARVSPQWETEIQNSDQHAVLLFSHRSDVEAYNADRSAQLESKEVTFHGKLKGDIPMSALPVPIEISLKIGTQVMLVSNHPDGTWVNGTMGVITKLVGGNMGDIIEPYTKVMTTDGETIVVHPHTWSQVDYDYDDETGQIVERQTGSYTQLPLIIAYAITVHKAQGQTCDRIVVDPSRFFAPGQGYVALSRCRSLEGLTLTQPINPHNLRTDSSVLEFYKQVIART
jgi:tetratricopeptide repeat protein